MAWMICAEPGSVALAVIDVDRFVAVVTERIPGVAVDSTPDGWVSVRVWGGGYDLTLARDPVQLAVGSVPSRSALVELAVMMRALVPPSTPMSIVAYETNMEFVRIELDSTAEDLAVAVGEEDWPGEPWDGVAVVAPSPAVGVVLPLEWSTDLAAQQVRAFEGVGVDRVVTTAWASMDNPHQRGVLALTHRVQLCLEFSASTDQPVSVALGAAGAAESTRGRSMLGLRLPRTGGGGVAVLHRVREFVVQCRAQWAVYQKEYTGHGVEVPVVLMGADGGGSVALAAELCEGWQPSVFLPEQAGRVFGPWLAEGEARRSAGLGPLELVADVVLRVTDDEGDLVKALAATRRHLARLVGGGGEGSEVVALLAAFGYGREVERCLALQASGDAEAAALALGDSLPRQVSLVGSRAEVADRVRAFRAAGVSTFVSRPVAEEPADRVADVVALRELLQ